MMLLLKKKNGHLQFISRDLNGLVADRDRPNWPCSLICMTFIAHKSTPINANSQAHTLR